MLYTIRHMSELPDAMMKILGHHYGDVDLSGKTGNIKHSELPTILVSLIGAPSSGKSTASTVLMRSDFLGLCKMNICSDDIQSMSRATAEQGIDADTWNSVSQQLDDALNVHGNMVIFDAAVSDIKDRRRLHQMALEHDALFIEIWCDTSLEECLKRNSERESKTLPADVLVRMNAALRMYSPINDTFADDIIVIKNAS